MLSRDRRTGARVPIELYLNQYIADRPYRVLANNLSETGIFVSRIGQTHRFACGAEQAALEFELPGTGEVIWARGEIAYQTRDSLFSSDGIRFTAMPRIHARLLRDYCIEERRASLSRLLQRIQRPLH